MDAKVIWSSGLAFDAAAGGELHLSLGGGLSPSFKPMELFAMGLGGCTAMDVISILTKKGQRVAAFEVQVHLEQATEHPKVFVSAVLEYLVTGKAIDEAAVVRSIELSATRYCPAHAMLVQAFPLRLKYQIFEDCEDGSRSLVTSGTYLPPTVETVG